MDGSHYLDNVSFELLKLYSRRKQLSAQDISAITNTDVRTIYESVQYLVDKNYLRACITVRDMGMFNLPYRITFEGLIALEGSQKHRKDYIFNEFRAWVTLAIALAAFIKSFFF